MPKFKLKPFQPSEYSEQTVVFEWARLHAGHQPLLKLLHANLNGLRLPIGLAVKAKKAGMAIGVPDMFLPVPMTYEAGGKSFWHGGLYLELKRRDGGRLSEAQRWWIEHLTALGYKVVVPAGSEMAIREICQYLNYNP